MKLKLTFNITVTYILDTKEAGYTNPDDVASCVAEEQAWLDGDSTYVEDMDFTNAITVITGEAV